MVTHRKIATAAATFFGAVILFFMTALPLPAQLPPSKGAPKAGQKAPDFTLPDSTGRPVTLSTLRAGAPTVDGSTAEIRGQWVLLIFYRGYW
jgi:cytochrome oxidase Cu insertion factor (SCO1/SenC/PrrC family)